MRQKVASLKIALMLVLLSFSLSDCRDDRSKSELDAVYSDDGWVLLLSRLLESDIGIYKGYGLVLCHKDKSPLLAQGKLDDNEVSKTCSYVFEERVKVDSWKEATFTKLPPNIILDRAQRQFADAKHSYDDDKIPAQERYLLTKTKEIISLKSAYQSKLDEREKIANPPKPKEQAPTPQPPDDEAPAPEKVAPKADPAAEQKPAPTNPPAKAKPVVTPKPAPAQNRPAPAPNQQSGYVEPRPIPGASPGIMPRRPTTSEVIELPNGEYRRKDEVTPPPPVKTKEQLLSELDTVILAKGKRIEEAKQDYKQGEDRLKDLKAKREKLTLESILSSYSKVHQELSRLYKDIYSANLPEAARSEESVLELLIAIRDIGGIDSYGQQKLKFSCKLIERFGPNIKDLLTIRGCDTTEPPSIPEHDLGAEKGEADYIYPGVYKNHELGAVRITTTHVDKKTAAFQLKFIDYPSNSSKILETDYTCNAARKVCLPKDDIGIVVLLSNEESITFVNTDNHRFSFVKRPDIFAGIYESTIKGKSEGTPDRVVVLAVTDSLDNLVSIDGLPGGDLKDYTLKNFARDTTDPSDKKFRLDLQVPDQKTPGAMVTVSYHLEIVDATTLSLRGGQTFEAKMVYQNPIVASLTSGKYYEDSAKTELEHVKILSKKLYPYEFEVTFPGEPAIMIRCETEKSVDCASDSGKTKITLTRSERQGTSFSADRLQTDQSWARKTYKWRTPLQAGQGGTP